jgi:hypothetical protein
VYSVCLYENCKRRRTKRLRPVKRVKLKFRNVRVVGILLSVAVEKERMEIIEAEKSVADFKGKQQSMSQRKEYLLSSIAELRQQVNVKRECEDF